MRNSKIVIAVALVVLAMSATTAAGAPRIETDDRAAVVNVLDAPSCTRTARYATAADPLTGVLPSEEEIQATMSWLTDPVVEPSIARLTAAVYDPRASDYLGYFVDHDTKTVTVVVDQGSQYAVREEVSQLVSGSGLTVEVRPACNTISDLRSVDAALAARDWHPESSGASYAFGVDPATGRVLVRVSAEDAHLSDDLMARFGALVDIEIADVSRRSRQADGSPHWGGARINDSGNDEWACTAGFAVDRDGGRWMVTNGHCVELGELVYSSHKYYGFVSQVSLPDPDVALIGSGIEEYERKLHVDPCCPTNRLVTSKAWPAIGSDVCISGAFTTARCSVEVKLYNQTVCDALGCTTNLIWAEREGTVINVDGDSGAPIYKGTSGNTARIYGLNVAGTDNGQYDDTYFHKYSTVEAELGVTVATSCCTSTSW